MSTIMAIAILKVNNRSSIKGGNGNTIMARIIIIRTGPAKVLKLLIFAKDDNAIAVFIVSAIKNLKKN